MTKLHSHRLDTEQTDSKPFIYLSMYVLVKMKVGPSLVFCFDKCERRSEALEPRMAHTAGAYPGFCSMKRLEVQSTLS